MTTPTIFTSIPRQTGLLITGLALAALAGCAAKSTIPAAAPVAPAAGPTTAAPAATPASAERTWASFYTDPANTVEGGYINPFSYSEKPGDVALEPLQIRGDTLEVRGRFIALGASSWSGLGVSVESGTHQAIDASGFKTLRIRLAAPAGAKLRLRLNGNDTKVRDSGCYPSFSQTVGAQDKAYDIPLARFVPEAYCGANGASSAKTLPRLVSVEVADTSNPVKTRSAHFTIGTITLLP